MSRLPFALAPFVQSVPFTPDNIRYGDIVTCFFCIKL